MFRSTGYNILMQYLKIRFEEFGNTEKKYIYIRND